jgi:DHA2 family methylenomycin A resistance protein-like MFS transporter
VQFIAIGAGLGLLAPSLTSTLLGSVEKTRSGIAAGVLNSTRQTGSVLGVALFGSLVSHVNNFIPAAHESLIISVVLLLGATVMMMVSKGAKPSRKFNSAPLLGKSLS